MSTSEKVVLSQYIRGDDHEKYNEIIKELRNDHDLKQEFVAKKLGITKQQYSLYETGQRRFSIEHIIALCTLFNVSADYMLGLPDLPYPKR